MSPQNLRLCTDLMHECNAQLKIYARQWCDDPEDVVQEAFIELIKRAEMPESPRAWLFRVVRNRALNQTRSVKRRRRREAENAISPENWFEAESDLQVDAVEVTKALKGLRPNLRETVIARLWGQLSFEEISKLMNVSTSSAFRRYAQAIDELRQILNADRPLASREK